MCARFSRHSDPQVLAEFSRLLRLQRRLRCPCPASMSPPRKSRSWVVDGPRRLEVMRWGLMPHGPRTPGLARAPSTRGPRRWLTSPPSAPPSARVVAWCRLTASTSGRGLASNAPRSTFIEPTAARWRWPGSGSGMNSLVSRSRSSLRRPAPGCRPSTTACRQSWNLPIGTRGSQPTTTTRAGKPLCCVRRRRTRCAAIRSAVPSMRSPTTGPELIQPIAAARPTQHRPARKSIRHSLETRALIRLPQLKR